MASVQVKGHRKLRKKYRGMANVARLASPAVKDSLGEALKTAKRRNFGFKDRTRRLRQSLRVEQARDVRGRFATAYQLVANRRYAGYVELKPRTKDRRPGPPYWLARAVALARGRIERRLQRDMRKRVRQEARKP